MKVPFASVLFISVALLIAGLQGATLSSSSEAQPADSAKQVKKVIELFFAALHKANVSQAYYGYTAVEFRQATSWRDFQAFIERYPSMQRNVDFQISQPEFYDTTATVDVNVSSADHKENSLVFDMYFQSGQWRILGIQLYSNKSTK